MKVEHQSEQKKFVINVDEDTAFLEYRIPEEGVVEFIRTIVPESRRGMGIASELVGEGVRWARSKGARIKATCPYVKKWLEKEKISPLTDM